MRRVFHSVVDDPMFSSAVTTLLFRLLLAAVVVWPAGGSCCCARNTTNTQPGCCSVRVAAAPVRRACCAARVKSAVRSNPSSATELKSKAPCRCLAHQPAADRSRSARMATPDVFAVAVIPERTLARSWRDRILMPRMSRSPERGVSSVELCAELCRWLA